MTMSPKTSKEDSHADKAEAKKDSFFTVDWIAELNWMKLSLWH